jgi:hypothetical protein
MATKKKIPVKKKIEESVKALTEESQELIKQRNAYHEQLDLIQKRLIEIQGGINVLVPLLQD